MQILPCRLLLRLWYAQRYLVAIWRCHKGAFFLCGSQARENVPEGDSVGANPEGGSPLFGYYLGKAGDASFGEAVVGLAAGG